MSVYTQRIVQRDPDNKPEGYTRFEYWQGAEAKFIAIANYIRHSGAGLDELQAWIDAFAATFPICLGFLRQLNFLLELRRDGILN